jgi:hypothetical protein
MRALGFAVKSQRYTRIIAISGPPTRFAAHNPRDGYRGGGRLAELTKTGTAPTANAGSAPILLFLIRDECRTDQSV